MDDASMTLSFTHGAILVLRLVMEVVLLGVAATVVRRATPTAAWLIAGGALIGIVNLCLSPALTAVLARSSGPEEMVGQMVIVSSIGAVLGAVSFALLIAGIARLAAAVARGASPRDPEVA